MFHLAKLERYMGSILKRYEGGLLRVLLTPELLQTLADAKRGCLILNRLVVVWNQRSMSLHLPEVQLNKNLRSFIVEFHQTNNYPILNDSKLCYRLLSQIARLLPTLARVSTTTNQDFPNWWNWYVGNRSEELWSPSKTDFCDLDTNSLKKCVKSIMSKSWFTLTNNAVSKKQKTWKRKNSKKTSCPLSTSLLPDEMEKKQEFLEDSEKNKENPNSMIKIKLKPTLEQRTLLNKIFGSHRAIYNKLVEESSSDCYKLSKKDLAEKYRGISQKHSIHNYLPVYHHEIPEEVMDSTYRDFERAIKSSKALFFVLKEKEKEKDTTFPELKFKSRKDNSSSIEIRSRSFKETDIGKIRIFSKYFGFKKGDGIEVMEDLPDLNFSVRLQRTRQMGFYLCIPRARQFTPSQTGRACAIDPGVRDFITVYDPKGFTLGVTDAKDAIFQRCLVIDRLKCTLSKESEKRVRYRLHQKIYNSTQRIKKMIKDMHQKVSKWLSVNYDEVLLPTFETSQMTRKQKRISSKTSRKILTWSHYAFRSLLSYKMERTGGRLIECTEPYTSKTCSRCGIINHNIKKQKTFCCPSCDHTLDRDINAARNIYMMNEHLLTWTLRVQ